MNFTNPKIFCTIFSKGFLTAVGLISCVLIPILCGHWITFVDPLDFTYLVNAILLGLVVGFAEELIFRGWLLNEANLFLGPISSISFQAIFFSLSHIIAFLKSGLGVFELIFLLFGLFLLGLMLGLVLGLMSLVRSGTKSGDWTGRSS